jgi:acyl carrier protein
MATWREQMSVRDSVRRAFEEVAAQQGRKLPELVDDLKLVDCRLDSLGIAIVIMRLEDQLGFDPFERDPDLEFPIIFSDFVRLYESRGAVFAPR